MKYPSDWFSNTREQAVAHSGIDIFGEVCEALDESQTLAQGAGAPKEVLLHLKGDMTETLLFHAASKSAAQFGQNRPSHTEEELQAHLALFCREWVRDRLVRKGHKEFAEGLAAVTSALRGSRT